jgi:hypothetical protein
VQWTGPKYPTTAAVRWRTFASSTFSSPHSKRELLRPRLVRFLCATASNEMAPKHE